jgi:hypothetical protein
MRAVAVCLALALAASAQARVPSTKTVLPSSSGARSDHTVPYLTNGRSTLGVANGVAPVIYSFPNLNAQGSPGPLAVYNLPFHGAKILGSSGILGAGPVQPNILRRGR